MSYPVSKKEKLKRIGIQTLLLLMLIVVGVSWYIYGTLTKGRINELNKELVQKNEVLDLINDSLVQKNDSLRYITKLQQQLIEMTEKRDSEINKNRKLKRQLEDTLKQYTYVQSVRDSLQQHINDLAEDNRRQDREKAHARKELEEQIRKLKIGSTILDSLKKQITSFEKRMSWYKIKADFTKVKIEGANTMKFWIRLRNWKRFKDEFGNNPQLGLKVFDIEKGDYICPTTSTNSNNCYTSYGWPLKDSSDLAIKFTSNDAHAFQGKLNSNRKGKGFRFEVYLSSSKLSDPIEIGSTTRFFN